MNDQAPSIANAAVGTGLTEAPPLLEALAALDRYLAAAFERAEASYGPRAALDGLRGLHLGREDIERALAASPGIPMLASSPDAVYQAAQGDPRFGWLIAAYGLDAFETACLLIALAPELDLRYERVYAYLQDDVTRKRPAADLMLTLLCASRDVRLERLSSLFGGTLFRQRLLFTSAGHAPSLSSELRVDPQITRFLLGDTGLDVRLQASCTLLVPRNGNPFDCDAAQAALRIAEAAVAAEKPLRLYFEGAHGTGKQYAAEAIAARRGLRVLSADLRGLRDAAEGFAEALALALREAWLQDALVFLHGYDALAQTNAPQMLRTLNAAIARHPGALVVAAESSPRVAGPQPPGLQRVHFAHPDRAARQRCWTQQLAAHGIALPVNEVRLLATRFAVNFDHIVSAAATLAGACDEALADAADTPFERLCAAVRAQCGHDLAALARKIEPRADWDALVLADDTRAQLRELCDRAAQGDRVLRDWGFDARLSLGKGITALFAGPSGTGKTLAAEVVAHALGLDLYKIDLSGVVSKYIGETERNLNRVFTAAASANAVLFFDEADALFGKRSEVRDSHDRYANIEVAYLLQKMEEFEGVAILATNLRQNLDEAFTRRLAFTVHFPYPEEADRLAIWQSIWPAAVQLAPDVNLPHLAREFPLSGGNIKNTALAAAYYAAANGGIVTQAYLLHATRREYQKMGKSTLVKSSKDKAAI